MSILEVFIVALALLLVPGFQALEQSVDLSNKLSTKDDRFNQIHEHLNLRRDSITPLTQKEISEKNPSALTDPRVHSEIAGASLPITAFQRQQPAPVAAHPVMVPMSRESPSSESNLESSAERPITLVKRPDSLPAIREKIPSMPANFVSELESSSSSLVKPDVSSSQTNRLEPASSLNSSRSAKIAAKIPSMKSLPVVSEKSASVQTLPKKTIAAQPAVDARLFENRHGLSNLKHQELILSQLQSPEFSLVFDPRFLARALPKSSAETIEQQQQPIEETSQAVQWPESRQLPLGGGGAGGGLTGGLGNLPILGNLMGGGNNKPAADGSSKPAPSSPMSGLPLIG